MKRRLEIRTQGEKEGNKNSHELKARKPGIGVQEEEQRETLHAYIDKVFTSGQVLEVVIDVRSKDSYYKELDRITAKVCEPKAAPKRKEGKKLNALKRKILLYFKMGKTTKEVAGRVHRSPHTVISHLKNLYKEYGVHKITEMIEVAERDHLLEE